MLSAHEIDAARHRIPLHELVGRDVALKRQGAWWVGRCPLHEDSSPSFGIKGDHWTCFAGCGSGSAIDYYMRRRGVDFPTAVRELANLPAAAAAAPQRPTTPARAAAERQVPDLVDAIMRQSGPIGDRTPAHLYLWSRGLPTRQPGLLAHPSLYCHEIGKPLPALIAPITNSAGEVTAVQRIWLSDRLVIAADKAAIDSRAVLDVRKKTLGSMGDGSVRLVPAARRMGLAEGPETAVAAAALYRVPVWATCGLSRLGYPAHWSIPKDDGERHWIEERPPTIWIPPEVEELWLFGDNGTIGHVVADFAAAWWTRQGLPCGAIYPDALYDDFNTMLRAGAR